jgi:putative membrane protein
MNTLSTSSQDRLYRRVIAVVSVAIPIVVAILFYMQRTGKNITYESVDFLPHLNAFINSATFVALVAGFIAIKRKNIAWHRLCMMTAFVLSSIFLVSYVIYHTFGTHTPYGGEGWIRSLYFFILITHIALSAIVVPLVLFALYFAYTKQYAKHRKIVKWAYPVWAYVAASGVTVYLMISPYYS